MEVGKKILGSIFIDEANLAVLLEKGLKREFFPNEVQRNVFGICQELYNNKTEVSSHAVASIAVDRGVINNPIHIQNLTDYGDIVFIMITTLVN